MDKKDLRLGLSIWVTAWAVLALLCRGGLPTVGWAGAVFLGGVASVFLVVPVGFAVGLVVAIFGTVAHRDRRRAS